MTLLVGTAAVVIVVAFVFWMWTHHKLKFRKTLRQIRELPEHVRK